MMISFYDARLTESGKPTLIKEKEAEYSEQIMDCPQAAARLSYSLLNLEQMAEEHIYMLSLDASCRITGVFLISKGTADTSLASPREVYIRALLAGAVQIILIHNHPSGSLLPSRPDIELTKRMDEAGKLIGVKLSDHLITGGNGRGYFSFKEAEMIGKET